MSLGTSQALHWKREQNFPSNSSNNILEKDFHDFIEKENVYDLLKEFVYIDSKLSKC